MEIRPRGLFCSRVITQRVLFFLPITKAKNLQSSYKVNLPIWFFTGRRFISRFVLKDGLKKYRLPNQTNISAADRAKANWALWPLNKVRCLPVGKRSKNVINFLKKNLQVKKSPGLRTGEDLELCQLILSSGKAEQAACTTGLFTKRLKEICGRYSAFFHKN